ncbi:hypothetical protein PTKIN_Ptkin02bG0212600 [Pterospermum kingtungense]
MSKARSIFKFTLRVIFDWEFDERDARTWISTAVGRNVQELCLDFGLGPEVNLPGCLFSCKTLVSLELDNEISIDVPATVDLPCLRILQLKRVHYANDDTLRRLFSSCPVLEDLTIIRTSYDNIIVLDINVPSLKRITVARFSCFDDITCKDKLLITAPMLERIDVKVRRLWDFLAEDASNLAEATIEAFAEWSNEHQLFNLLKKMANVRFLSFGKFTTWPVRPYEAEFPVFQNLVRLEITFACRYFYTLLDLLECSDNLKTLVFCGSFQDQYSECGCDQELVGSAPKCVSMSLETLIFSRVRYICEFHFLRYVLNNAKFLKQMKIIGMSFQFTELNRHIRSLLDCPRASMPCDISFSFES